MPKLKTKRKLTKKARKRMGYGRVKGGKFERAICKDVVKAFSRYKIGSQDIYRSVQSGAHAASFGDISMSTKMMKLFPFAPECKFYKKLNAHDLFTPWRKMPDSLWFKKWWLQAIRGAEKRKGMIPLLIFKSNNNPILCAFPYEVIGEKHELSKVTSYPHMVFFDKKEDGHRRPIWLGKWEQFLSAVSIRKK